MRRESAPEEQVLEQLSRRLEGARLERGSISSAVPRAIMMKKPRAMICTLDSFAFFRCFITLPSSLFV